MASNCPIVDRLNYVPLAQAPEWLAPLAEQLCQQRLLEGLKPDRKRVLARLTRELGSNPLPTTTLALHPEGYLAACVSLGYLSPARQSAGLWLSNLWVAPQLRGQGVGRHLCRLVMAQAKVLGASRLQLYTRDQHQFYLAQGWQLKRCMRLNRQPLRIMSIALK